jgi:hypothetical protein
MKYVSQQPRSIEIKRTQGISQNNTIIIEVVGKTNIIKNIKLNPLKRGSAKGEPNVAGEIFFPDFVFANERSDQTIDKSKILARLVLLMKNAS